MAETVCCPDCGTELPSDPEVRGLCPQCLLSLALKDSPAGPDAGWLGTASADSDAPATLDRPTPGRILGERYQIREVLGRGGMGEVFRAFDLKLRVEVALKAVRAEKVESERAREMLRGEVRSAREVLSPNVCRIFDLVAEDGQELVSMEFIDGTTLGDTLKQRGPLALQEAREIASQFLSGLEAIHQAGLVHRDFKPENVMLTRAGRVVVMDFGLAKARTEGETGTIAGTPAYMAPEQARGEAVDARADVYAAGVVLAEMLSVGGVGSGEARQALWRSVRQVPPGVPDGPWAPALRQALAANPDERHGSARALAHALEEVTQRLPGFETKRPYPGLSSFTEEDADYFFGRELEVEALWKKLKRPRMLALVAPSGAGKSSFLRAGVLSTLPKGWKAVVTTPGSRPFQSLARTLAPAFAGDGSAFEALLRFDEEDIAVSLLQRFRQRHEHALVILDQFEELFTLNPAEVQAAFARLLGRLVIDADLHVVLSLRDDFLFRCHESEPLAPATSDLTILGKLGPAALRRALVQPALACGYRFEDEALVDEMMAEVQKERGALPLVAFAASRLWEKRDREKGLLTREAYREIGGVAGALAQHAEATLERIGTQRTPLVRELFRNLVTAQGTRAVREREELLSVFEASARRGEAAEVLNALVDARLLTSYERSGEAGESHHQVEIIHESLLTAWPRLVRWQTQDADGAQLRDQLRQAAQLWQDRGRNDDLLWSGTAYQDFSLWRQRYTAPLTATEDAFARSMEANATRQARRRRAAVATLVGVAATVAILTSVLWQRADASRRKAEAETLRAEASKLLALGERELERYPTAALAYTLKALELADTEGGRLLALRVVQLAPLARLAPEPDTVKTAFSPNGEWVALGGWTKVQLLHRGGGPTRLLGEFPSRGTALASVRFGPTSDVVVSNYGPEIREWSVSQGRELRRFRVTDETGDKHLTADGLITVTQAGTRALIRKWPFDGGEAQGIGSMEASPGQHAFGGGWLAYARGRKVYLRSYENGRLPPRLLLEDTAEVKSLELSPDGKRVAVGDGSTLRIVSTTPSGPERVLRAEPGDFDPGGRWLASGQTVEGRPRWRLFDLEAPPGAEPVVLTRADTDFRGWSSFDPSGQWYVTASSKQGTALWWLGGARPSVVLVSDDVERERIRDLAFTPDGRFVLSVSMTGTVRAWPMSAREKPRVLLGAVDWYHPVIAVHPSGGQVAVGLSRGRVFLVGMEGGPPRELKGFSARVSIGAVAFGDAGRLLAAAPGNGPREEKVVRVFDLATGAARTFGPLPGVGEGAAGSIPGLEFVDRDHLLASVTGAGLAAVNLATGEIRGLAKRPSGRFRLNLARRVGLGVDESEAGKGSEPLLEFSLEGATSTPLGSYPSSTAVAVDSPGSRVAAGSADGTIRIGSLAGGEPHVFFGHASPVVALAFSPDGRWLASTTLDRAIWLWPVPDVTKPPPHKRPYQELLAALRTHTNLRALPDPASPTGYKLEPGPFPGWAKAPEW